jgi:hypothetical protein
MTHFIKVATKEHVLPVGDTEPRARENMRRKPRQDASRAVAVHTRDRTVPQPVETVVRRSRQASQVHPQTREKDALGDTILFEVKESLWTRIARPANHPSRPAWFCPSITRPRRRARAFAILDRARTLLRHVGTVMAEEDAGRLGLDCVEPAA